MARRRLVSLLATGVVAPLLGWVPPALAAPPAAKPYDADGDGRQELVVGAPGLTVDSLEDSGGVVVLPGVAKGLSTKARLITPVTLDAYPEDTEYGSAGDGLASADFNRDGFADLVMTTASYIGYGTLVRTLAVIPGSASGLDPTHAVWLGNPDRHDDDPTGLSRVMATGDLTGDGYPDLAVGVPNAASYTAEGGVAKTSGKVFVFAGSSKGLIDRSPRELRGQDTGGGHQDWDDGFGVSLATADLDGDGSTDLVVGSRGDTSAPAPYPGSISVCPGAPGGPTGCTRLLHSADYVGLTKLAVGRVTGRSRPDVVVGVPDPGKDAAGSVRILQLKPTGPVAVDHKLVLTQSSIKVPGGDEPGDAFGRALALGDLDRDGFADLVVGTPGKNRKRGQVVVVHGSATGWRADGTAAYGQRTRGVPGKAEAGDQFGSSVTLLDHDGDGLLDLDVGAPGENRSGSVTAFRGSAGGPTTAGSKAYTLKTFSIRHRSGAGFGDPLGG